MSESKAAAVEKELASAKKVSEDAERGMDSTSGDMATPARSKAEASDGPAGSEEADVMADLKSRAKTSEGGSPDSKRLHKKGRASASTPAMSHSPGKKHKLKPLAQSTRSMSRSRSMGHVKGGGSTHRSAKSGHGGAVGFAGYEPPDQAVDESAVGEARSVMRDPDALKKILADTHTMTACRAVGINMEDLVPKSKADFKTEPERAAVLSKDQQRRRFDHFENRRLWKLAVVLTAAQEAQKKAEEEKKKKEHLGDELYSVFNQALEQERHRNGKIAGDRNKVETVLLKENELLKQRRAEFEEHEQRAKERDAAIVAQRERQKQEMKERAAKRQAEIDKLQKARSVRAAAKVVNAVNAFQARDARVKDYLDAKLAATGEVRKRKEEQNMRRAATREAAKERSEASRRELEGKLLTKAQQADIIRRKREEEMAQKKEEKKLQAQAKADNAARVRRVKLENKHKGANKMKAAYLRMELQRELRVAIEEDRRDKKKEAIIRTDHWTEATHLERNVTPGPGEYHHESKIGPAGGTWGKHKPKSDVEWQILRASELPGPGEYELPSEKRAGGSWGKHKPKSDVEWQMYRAAQIPGPGAYQPKELAAGASVKFGDHNPPSQLDLQIRRSAETPGPGAYSGDIMPKPKRRLKDIKKSLRDLSKTLADMDEVPTGLPEPSPIKRTGSMRPRTAT